MTLPGRPRRWD